MACSCIKLCECRPADWDVEERWGFVTQAASHFTHVHWSWAYSDPIQDIQTIFTNYGRTVSDAFSRLFGPQPSSNHVQDWLEEQRKKQRSLDTSRGRSPDHGPPCPPTPYRSDLRTVHHPSGTRGPVPLRR